MNLSILLIVIGIFMLFVYIISTLNLQLALKCKYKIYFNKKGKILVMHTNCSPACFIIIAGLTIFLLDCGVYPLLVLINNMVLFHLMNMTFSRLYMTLIVKRYFGYRTLERFIYHTEKKRKEMKREEKV